MQSSGGLADARRRRRPRRAHRAQRPGRRRGGRGAARRALRRARPAVLRHGRHVVRRVRRRGRPRARDDRRARSAAGRWRCRWSTSTPSAPAAARSAGATPAARCASARAARAPSPGPACYGRGGDRADGHRRQPRPRPPRAPTCRWPAASSSTPTRPHARRRAAGRRARASTSRECAEGIVRVANAEMVRALRVMTVERGIDPRRFALLAFGGAGPLHAAAIAEELGMTRILVPRASGVLSALGLAAADRRADAQRTVLGDDDARASTRWPTRSARRWAASARARGRLGRALPRPVARARPCAARERDELREALRGAARGALRLPRPRRRGRARHRARHRPPARAAASTSARPPASGSPGRRRRAARGDARRARGLERDAPTTPARWCWSAA